MLHTYSGYNMRSNLGLTDRKQNPIFLAMAFQYPAAESSYKKIFVLLKLVHNFARRIYCLGNKSSCNIIVQASFHLRIVFVESYEKFDFIQKCLHCMLLLPENFLFEWSTVGN